MHDAQLAIRAASGERDTWPAIYDLYADRLHDFCWSILRDRQEAQDALHDAFVTAAGKVGHVRDPARLGPWLYSLCRSQCLTRARRGGARTKPEGDAEAAGRPTAPRSEGYEIRQLRKLVWDAAGGLPARDRALLDLHLRHGLDGEELAEAIGTNANHASVLLARVRQNVERSLSALLVARAGRRNCAELNRMLSGWDGSLAPLLHKRVANHMDSCVTCTHERRRLVSPLVLLSGVPQVPAPKSLRERVLADLAPARRGTSPAVDAPAPNGSTGGPSHPWPATNRGVGDPAADHRAAANRAAAQRAAANRAAAQRAAPHQARSGWIAAAAALAVIAVLGTVLVVAATREEETATLGGTAVTTSLETTTAPEVPAATAASTTTPPPPTTTGTVAARGRPTVDLVTKAINFGASATVGVLNFRNTGGRPLRWTVSSTSPAVSVKPATGTLAPGGEANVNVVLDRSKVAEGDFTAQLRLVGAGTAYVPVSAVQNKSPEISDLVVVPGWLVAAPSGCATARVSATVADETLVTVMLSWQQAGGPIMDVPMSGAAGRFTTSIGPPISGTGDIRWWIVATDQRGNAGRITDRVLEVRPTDSPCPP